MIQAPVLRHSDKARNEGFGITLHLDSRTRSEIDEFSTSGFIGVKKDGESYTVTVPASQQVIDSVTSDSISEIAKSLGWKVDKRAVKYEELSSFDEVMAAGTAAALVPIRSITMRSRDDKIEYLKGEEPGPVCLKLLKTLQGIQRGEIEDKFGWNEKVQQPKGYETREVSGAASHQQNVNGKVQSAKVDQVD